LTYNVQAEPARPGDRGNARRVSVEVIGPGFPGVPPTPSEVRLRVLTTGVLVDRAEQALLDQIQIENAQPIDLEVVRRPLVPGASQSFQRSDE
jgi:hypothetical protein